MSSGRVNTRFSPRNRLAMKSGAKPSSTARSPADRCRSPARAQQAINDGAVERYPWMRLDRQLGPAHVDRPGGLLQSRATASVIRRQTAAPSESPASARAVLSASALSCGAVAGAGQQLRLLTL